MTAEASAYSEWVIFINIVRDLVICVDFIPGLDFPVNRNYSLEREGYFRWSLSSINGCFVSMNEFKKVFLLVLIVAVISLGGIGCKGNNELYTMI